MTDLRIHRIPAEVEQLEWYHPQANRHVAESLLHQNGTEGTYLIRPSSNPGEMALSIKCHGDDVRHIPLIWDGNKYTFGQGEFYTVEEMVDHFSRKPLIGVNSGTLTVLRYPYPNQVAEPSHYDGIDVHAVFGTVEDETESSDKSPDFTVSKKTGYLFKVGNFFKTWKKRWFVLQHDSLQYFANKDDHKPKGTISLSDCESCDWVTDSDPLDVQKYPNCFRLVTPKRTYFMYSMKEEDGHQWINLIKWKLAMRSRTSSQNQSLKSSQTSSTEKFSSLDSKGSEDLGKTENKDKTNDNFRRLSKRLPNKDELTWLAGDL